MSSFTEASLTPLKDGRHWRVNDDIRYDIGKLGSGLALVVEKGSVSDLASVPWIFWCIFPPTGKYTVPAIFHDELYRSGALSRAMADAIFREGMRDQGVGWFSRTAMYLAVRLFGWWAWRGHRKRRA